MAFTDQIMVGILGMNTTALIGVIGYLGRKTINNETRSKVNRRMIKHDRKN